MREKLRSEGRIASYGKKSLYDADMTSAANFSDRSSTAAQSV